MTGHDCNGCGAIKCPYCTNNKEIGEPCPQDGVPCDGNDGCTNCKEDS
jgi:hypothetical protein